MISGGKVPARNRFSTSSNSSCEMLRGAGELEAQPEEVVVHQEGEEDVGADVEGVVGFEDLREIGLPRLGDEDPPGEEHARRLAADPARADQPVPDGEEVVEGEVGIGQPVELRMGADHHPGELLLERGDLGRLLVEIEPRLVVLHQPPIDAVPGGERLLPCSGFLLADAERSGGVPAPEDRRPDGIGHHMGQEHLRRVAVPHLERVDVHVPVDLIDVDQELRRVADAGDGAVPVLAAGQGEVGHRVELEEERAGHLEEVREELVGGPLDDERREVVEDVEDLLALLFDDPVHLAAEGVEARPGDRPRSSRGRRAAAGSADGGRSGGRRSAARRGAPARRRAGRSGR